jgi:hypothetical protein
MLVLALQFSKNNRKTTNQPAPTSGNPKASTPARSKPTGSFKTEERTKNRTKHTLQGELNLQQAEHSDTDTSAPTSS